MGMMCAITGWSVEATPCKIMRHSRDAAVQGPDVSAKFKSPIRHGTSYSLLNHTHARLAWISDRMGLVEVQRRIVSNSESRMARRGFDCLDSDLDMTSEFF